LFEVETTPLALGYQWQFNGFDIPNAQGATLPIANVQEANAGSYRVFLTGCAGTTNSDTVFLSVSESAPVISAQPRRARKPLGNKAIFSI
jgi:hypothetical protein